MFYDLFLSGIFTNDFKDSFRFATELMVRFLLVLFVVFYQSGAK